MPHIDSIVQRACPVLDFFQMQESAEPSRYASLFELTKVFHNHYHLVFSAHIAVAVISGAPVINSIEFGRQTPNHLHSPIRRQIFKSSAHSSIFADLRL